MACIVCKVVETSIRVSQLLRAPFRGEPRFEVDRLSVTKHLVEVRVFEIVASFTRIHQRSKSDLSCDIVLSHSYLHLRPKGDWAMPLDVERPPCCKSANATVPFPKCYDVPVNRCTCKIKSLIWTRWPCIRSSDGHVRRSKDCVTKRATSCAAVMQMVAFGSLL